MFKKVEKKKVYMMIVEQIQDLIRKEKLKKGDRLPPERTLAQELGVSRAPLREALAALEILGVIESRGRNGNFIVNTFDYRRYMQRFKELEQGWSALEILEGRKEIEPGAASLAAERCSPEDISQLESILKKTEKAMAINDLSEFIRLNRQFHLTIAKASNNEVFFYIMNHIANDELNKKLWIKLDEKALLPSGRTNKYFRQHCKIVEAIKAKDKAKARKAVLYHLTSFERDLFGEDGVSKNSL